MTIDADGRRAAGGVRGSSARPAPLVYALAISPDGKQYAYPLEERDDPDGAGIYVSTFGGEAPPRSSP